MNDIPISKDRFRRAILCSLSLLGQGRPKLRCGTGTIRCLDSAVTLACLLILSTPKITFFSDRTSLARPSAFVRLVSFKRWSRYHTAVVRQQLFSKKLRFFSTTTTAIRYNLTFSLFSPFPPSSTPLPYPTTARSAILKIQRQQHLHPKTECTSNHRNTSTTILISKIQFHTHALSVEGLETTKTTADIVCRGIARTIPHSWKRFENSNAIECDEFFLFVEIMHSSIQKYFFRHSVSSHTTNTKSQQSPPRLLRKLFRFLIRSANISPR